jgi:DNA-binding NarL/FixJ family response regulator
MIRLVVVDDHTLFRRGLISLLSDMDVFEVVGEANNGEESLQIIMDSNPDVILLDVNMPTMGGLETLRTLRKNGVDVPTLMLTISQQSEDLIRAIQAGASGYLLKNAEPEILRRTIELVHAGEAVLAPEMTEKVFQLMRSGELDYNDLLSSRLDHVKGCLFSLYLREYGKDSYTPYLRKTGSKQSRRSGCQGNSNGDIVGKQSKGDDIWVMRKSPGYLT